MTKRFTDAKDAGNAEHWGQECLFVDVYDPECHILMADALLLAYGGAPSRRPDPRGTPRIHDVATPDHAAGVRTATRDSR